MTPLPSFLPCSVQSELSHLIQDPDPFTSKLAHLLLLRHLKHCPQYVLQPPPTTPLHYHLLHLLPFTHLRCSYCVLPPLTFVGTWTFSYLLLLAVWIHRIQMLSWQQCPVFLTLYCCAKVTSVPSCHLLPFSFSFPLSTGKDAVNLLQKLFELSTQTLYNCSADLNKAIHACIQHTFT